MHFKTMKKQPKDRHKPWKFYFFSLLYTNYTNSLETKKISIKKKKKFPERIFLKNLDAPFILSHFVFVSFYILNSLRIRKIEKTETEREEEEGRKKIIYE